MQQYGKVYSVSTRHAGADILDHSVSGGVLRLLVGDAAHFDEDGGHLTLRGVQFAYDGIDFDVEFEVDAVRVDFTDPTPEQVEAVALLEEDDRAAVVPAAPEAVALVSIAAGEDSLIARVDHSLVAMLPDGVRDDEEAETVRLESEGSGWVVADVFGRPGDYTHGDPDGMRVEIGDHGVALWTVGPNGEPYAPVRMGGGETSFGVMGQDGTRLGGISSLGAVSGTSGTFAGDVRVKGTPLVGQLGGGIAPGWLDNLPRGVLASAERMNPSTAIISTGTLFPHLHISARLFPGRRYRIVAGMRARLHNSPSALTLTLHHSVGTAKPTESAAQLGHQTYGSGINHSANHRLFVEAEAFYSVPTERVESFLMCYRGDYGGTPQRDSSTLYIEDVGPLIADTGGSGEDSENTVMYQTTWRASASRRYSRTGAAMSGRDGDIDLWYWRGSNPHEYHNTAWLYDAGAVEATHSVEFGKTLPQALNGATLHKVEVYIRNKMWYGGIPAGHVTLSPLAGTTLPSTKTIDGIFWVDDFGEGEGMWIEVPTSWFTNGANRGVAMGDRDGRALNGSGILTDLVSGGFHGIADADPPLLRATYSR